MDYYDDKPIDMGGGWIIDLEPYKVRRGLWIPLRRVCDEDFCEFREDLIKFLDKWFPDFERTKSYVGSWWTTVPHDEEYYKSRHR